MKEVTDKVYKTLSGRYEYTLDADNYDDWAIKLRRSLIFHKLWDHVNGNAKPPKSIEGEVEAHIQAKYDKEASKYEDGRLKACTAIVDSISEAILQQFITESMLEAPKLMWESLEKELGGSSAKKANELMSKFIRSRWNGVEKINDFYLRILKLQTAVNGEESIANPEELEVGSSASVVSGGSGSSAGGGKAQIRIKIDDLMMIERLLDIRHPDWTTVCDVLEMEKHRTPVIEIKRKLEIFESKMLHRAEEHLEILRTPTKAAAFAAQMQTSRITEIFDDADEDMDRVQRSPRNDYSKSRDVQNSSSNIFNNQNALTNYVPNNRMENQYIQQNNGYGNYTRNLQNEWRFQELPQAGPEYVGVGCWLHRTDEHQAPHCDELKKMQWDYNMQRGIDPARASRHYGYPSPTTRPNYTMNNVSERNQVPRHGNNMFNQQNRNFQRRPFVLNARSPPKRHSGMIGGTLHNGPSTPKKVRPEANITEVLEDLSPTEKGQANPFN